jgi:hypothetical protein
VLVLADSGGDLVAEVHEAGRRQRREQRLLLLAAVDLVDVVAHEVDHVVPQLGAQRSTLGQRVGLARDDREHDIHHEVVGQDLIDRRLPAVTIPLGGLRPDLVLVREGD